MIKKSKKEVKKRVFIFIFFKVNHRLKAKDESDIQKENRYVYLERYNNLKTERNWPY